MTEWQWNVIKALITILLNHQNNQYGVTVISKQYQKEFDLLNEALER